MKEKKKEKKNICTVKKFNNKKRPSLMYKHHIKQTEYIYIHKKNQTQALDLKNEKEKPTFHIHTHIYITYTYQLKIILTKKSNTNRTGYLI